MVPAAVDLTAEAVAVIIKKRNYFTRISRINTDSGPAQPVRENPCHPCSSVVKIPHSALRIPHLNWFVYFVYFVVQPILKPSR